MVAHMDKPELHVDTVQEWERFLETDPPAGGVRLRLRKKRSLLPGIGYAEALDVALCFGWIDGRRDALDADYLLQAFSPRRPRSIWSEVNKGHVTRLLAEGRIRPSGLAEIEAAKADGRWDAAYSQRSGRVPDELQAALDGNPLAAREFAARPSQERFAMVFRIANLKRESSRIARAELYVAMLERGERIVAER